MIGHKKKVLHQQKITRVLAVRVNPVKRGKSFLCAAKYGDAVVAAVGYQQKASVPRLANGGAGIACDSVRQCRELLFRLPAVTRFFHNGNFACQLARGIKRICPVDIANKMAHPAARGQSNRTSGGELALVHMVQGNAVNAKVGGSQLFPHPCAGMNVRPFLAFGVRPVAVMLGHAFQTRCSSGLDVKRADASA